MWSRNIALDLCKEVEAVSPEFGCHVALTGGILYKEGPRKDLDLLFYRIRQVEKIDEEGLLLKLIDLGFTMQERFGWVQKARYWDMDVDMFFPEEQSNTQKEINIRRSSFGAKYFSNSVAEAIYSA